MALTQISTGGVKDDAVTAGKIPANAVGSSEIADDAVDQGAIADEAVDEARLQISNAGSNGQFLQKQSGNTGGLTWATVTVPDSDKIEEGNTSIETVDTGSDGHVKITTEGTERVRVTNDGKLGIGVTNPSHDVSVVKGGSTIISAKCTASGSGANAALRLESADSSSDWYVQTGNAASGGLRFYNGSERFRLGASGQLGVGGANYGTSGQVLTSGGAGAAPSWADGGGGMWKLIANADVASASGNEYDIFTDFASHTDKKFWKLVFRIEAPSGDNDFSGSGIRVKVNNQWRSNSYDFQQFYVESTNEVGSRKDNQSRFSFTNRDEKWHAGEIMFYDPNATDVYKIFDFHGYAADHAWDSSTDHPNITRAVGGYVGGLQAIQGIRFWKNSGNFGKIHYGLFASNGW